jgi:NADH dehydrogenase FAD-containing subunit
MPPPNTHTHTHAHTLTALANFKDTGVTVRLNVRVTGVTRDTIQLTHDGKEETLEYGLCVWSTGGFGWGGGWPGPAI